MTNDAASSVILKLKLLLWANNIMCYVHNAQCCMHYTKCVQGVQGVQGDLYSVCETMMQQSIRLLFISICNFAI